MTLWGGIEAGGTKVICAVGTGSGKIVEKDQFDTRTPEETIAQITYFLSLIA